MDELKAALGTHADATVFRKLAALGYRTSYSHRGRYYTLDEVARFDAVGLWSFRAVYFSKFGTLVATAEALVAAAEAGYDAGELAALLHVDVGSPCSNWCAPSAFPASRCRVATSTSHLSPLFAVLSCAPVRYMTQRRAVFPSARASWSSQTS
ncbi:MAG: hypothetical protein M0008_01830 [Actinomycetota bacterium]|jgi:hypothetical protein|nr:hypothetical protein [Actinomycetota bacterium]